MESTQRQKCRLLTLVRNTNAPKLQGTLYLLLIKYCGTPCVVICFLL